jgi:hypothetical protein
VRAQEHVGQYEDADHERVERQASHGNSYRRFTAGY